MDKWLPDAASGNKHQSRNGVKQMTDYENLMDEFADAQKMTFSERCKARSAIRAAIEALLGEVEQVKGFWKEAQLRNRNLLEEGNDLAMLADQYKAERDAYQQAADKMAAEHKVERDAMQGEVELLTRQWAEWSDSLDSVMKQRNALQAKLDELQRQEPVKFLVKGAKFKLANCGPSSSGFVGFPKELAGRWVALVAADDDCHLKLAAPKALEPLSEARVKEFYEALKDDKRSQNFTNENWFQCGIATAEAAHGITKGTPT